jgi:hypothetical protein
LDFRSIKTNMDMEMLRCKTPDRVKKEIAIHFIGLQHHPWQCGAGRRFA